MIDLAYLQEQIEMNKRNELLKKHPYKIWEGKDGKWYTYIPDKKRGRILKKRITREAIENDVIEYWKSEIDNPCISEVFHEWNDRRLELKKISMATHLRNKQIFYRHYNEFGNRKMKNIDVYVINALIGFLKSAALTKMNSLEFLCQLFSVLFEIENMKYFAPLSSPKQKHLTMRNNIDFHKLQEGKLGAINFNNMIPVPDGEYSVIDTRSESLTYQEEKYKILLQNQLRWLNRDGRMLRNIAYSLYEKRINGTLSNRIQRRCCDFYLLEKKFFANSK